MNQINGKPIAEFNTKLSDVLLRRIFSRNVLVSILVAGVFTYVAITADNPPETSPLRVLLFVSISIGIPVGFLLYNLFWKKLYIAKIYENGIILTKKPSGKIIELDFAKITGVRDILWEHEVLLFSLLKTRELEIHLENQKRPMSLDGRSIADIKRFSSTLSEALETYRGKEES